MARKMMWGVPEKIPKHTELTPRQRSFANTLGSVVNATIKPKKKY
jgi:hypothetical protein